MEILNIATDWANAEAIASIFSSFLKVEEVRKYFTSLLILQA